MAKHFENIYEQGWFGDVPKNNIPRYSIVNNQVEEVQTITVHSFTMGDVEDPDLYAAQPLYEWEHSEKGQWVMANAVETPSWHRIADVATFGYRYCIRAKLRGPELTLWLLKYADK